MVGSRVMIKKKLVFLLLVVVSFFSFGPMGSVVHAAYNCMAAGLCHGGGTIVADYYCDGCPTGQVCCYDEEKGDVTVKSDSDLWEKIFGTDSLLLNIFQPSNLWEGHATVLTYVGVLISAGFIILFLATIFAILIGALKWVSSQGVQEKIISAQKWMKNAIIGFFSTGAVFILVNIITFFFGIGNIFEMAENFSVCDGQTLYEWKQDNPGWGTSTTCMPDYECEAAGGSIGASCGPAGLFECTQSKTPTCTDAGWGTTY